MDLEDIAHALGATVIRETPSGRRWGSYCHHTRTIRLHPDLVALQRDYVLAHELGHHYYGHTGCDPRWEWEADVYAATMLIKRDEWSRATRIHERVEAVAVELSVLPKAVRIYYTHPKEARNVRQQEGYAGYYSRCE